ncbi:MAG: hypothetical protein PHR39_07810, partial [Actinomycetota bacterium]|nr:hypothetical protein [Actinomycetota bacterium]
MKNANYKFESKTNISLFLISFSIFLYQVCLLRIISISDYYHFAFLIVSIALLGFGISGSFLYFFIEKLKDPNLIRIFFAFGFSVSVFISYVLVNHIPFDSFKIAWEAKQILYLVIYYFFLLLPFFFGGSFIGYILHTCKKPGVTYFYNLIGSALGSITFIFIAGLTGKTNVMIAASFIGIISTFLFLVKRYLKTVLLLSITFIIFVTSAIIFYPEIFDTRMSPYKSLPVVLRYPDSKIISVKENSYSLVHIVESMAIKSAPGLSLKYENIPPEQLGLTLDGDNLSAITHVKNEAGFVGSVDFLNYMPASIIFGLKPNPENILIVEPGGGLDVLGALYFAQDSDISIIQNNNLIADILKYDEYVFSFSGDLYNKKNVNVQKIPLRNFLKKTNDDFDLIILSLSDSFHPISSGAYSLNEDYLYTVESISKLMKSLNKDGILAITRWIQYPPSEDLKMIATMKESSQKLKIPDFDRKILAFRSWSTMTILFKNSVFDNQEINQAKNKLVKLNFDVVYHEGVKSEETNIYNQTEKSYYHDFFKKIINGSNQERNAFYEDYYFNIEPSTDNCPYFYNFFKLRQIPDIVRYFGKSTQPFGGGGYLILISALVLCILFSFLLILLPLKLKKINIDFKKDFKFLIYFFAIGLGFFFIELPLIQKFILVLDKPAYSLAVILFSLMLFSGL